MARPPNVLPSVRINLKLREDVYAQLVAHLYSPSEGRVPVGAFQKFFSERISDFFRQQETKS